MSSRGYIQHNNTRGAEWELPQHNNTLRSRKSSADGEYLLSTVFVGLAHNIVTVFLSRQRPPLYFYVATMVYSGVRLLFVQTNDRDKVIYF